MANGEHGVSTGDLIQQLRDEVLLLIRQERAFLKAEVNEKVEQGKQAVTYGVALAVVGYLAFVFILVTATLGMIAGLRVAGLETQAPWIATSIMALILLAVSGFLMSKLRDVAKRKVPKV